MTHVLFGKCLAVMSVLVLAATGLWAAGEEEGSTAAAADKRYVTDPTTGNAVVASEYGGTITAWWATGRTQLAFDPYYGCARADGDFTEYERLPFDVEHEESVLEQWLESNPDKILEDGRILILGRQVRTDLGGFIDLLGVDREGNVVVVELKRDRTPRDVVAQALEYAAFAARLDVDALEGILRVHVHDESLSLADCHRECFSVDQSEAVAFNKGSTHRGRRPSRSAIRVHYGQSGDVVEVRIMGEQQRSGL